MSENNNELLFRNYKNCMYLVRFFANQHFFSHNLLGFMLSRDYRVRRLYKFYQCVEFMVFYFYMQYIFQVPYNLMLLVCTSTAIYY